MVRWPEAQLQYVQGPAEPSIYRSPYILLASERCLRVEFLSLLFGCHACSRHLMPRPRHSSSDIGHKLAYFAPSPQGPSHVATRDA